LKIPIEFVESDERGLEWIEPLWQQLREHHQQRSRNFAGRYAHFPFEQRRQTLLEKAREGSLHIDLARDPDSGAWVGYCVSSLSAGQEGEIESLCVDGAYRGQGIGEGLMQRALDWLDRSGAAVKRLSVAAGNEEAFSFYARFGFYPKSTILEQIRS
jgi:diamine N-acetyltransferase